MNEKSSKVQLREITRDPMALEIRKELPWVSELLERSAPGPKVGIEDSKAWSQAAQFEAELTVQKLDSGMDYLVQGSLRAQVPALCGRCGDDFQSQRASEFRVFLHPSDRRRNNPEEDFEDTEYREFSGQHIDLIDILSEQLVLSEPMVDCPARKDNGDCTLCGKNPHVYEEQNSQLVEERDGQWQEKKADSPFAAALRNKIKGV